MCYNSDQTTYSAPYIGHISLFAVPGYPVNVTLVQLNTSTIKVSWIAPTTGVTVTGYRVHYVIDNTMGNVVDKAEDVGANGQEWQISLCEEQSYNITLTVRSLSETLASPGVAVATPESKKSSYFQKLLEAHGCHFCT